MAATGFSIFIFAFCVCASLVKLCRSRLNPGERAGDWFYLLFFIVGESPIIGIFDGICIDDFDVVISAVDKVVIVKVPLDSIFEEVGLAYFHGIDSVIKERQTHICRPIPDAQFLKLECTVVFIVLFFSELAQRE